MINFVIKENKGLESIARIKRMVMVSTSVVLALYIVIAGGMTGWTAWVSSRQKQTSTTNDELTRQINTLFDSEVVVRNLASRATMVQGFLKDRGNASEASHLVRKDGFPIFKWEYNALGATTVGVSASEPAQLQVYAQYLETNYSKVQTAKIEWDPKNGWAGTFIISGRKKT